MAATVVLTATPFFGMMIDSLNRSGKWWFNERYRTDGREPGEFRRSYGCAIFWLSFLGIVARPMHWSLLTVVNLPESQGTVVMTKKYQSFACP